MIGAAKPRFSSRLALCGAVLACLALASLALVGCAGDDPAASVPRPAPAPMVTPKPPPPSPEFNASVAKPLPLPEPPSFKTLPPPRSPGPRAHIAPLPRPEPLKLGTTPIPEPSPPAQLAKPMARPADAPESTAIPPDTAETPEPPPPTGSDTDIMGIAGGYRLLFAPGSRELPATAAALLREIAEDMSREPLLRLRVAAYASGEAENPVPARRLSLQRALKVREALAGEGIASLRVDILALGLNAGSPPWDRVDLIPVR